MYKFYVQHDYEIYPTIVELEADDQFDAFRKLIDKLEKSTIIGKILEVKMEG